MTEANISWQSGKETVAEEGISTIKINGVNVRVEHTHVGGHRLTIEAGKKGPIVVFPGKGAILTVGGSMVNVGHKGSL